MISYIAVFSVVGMVVAAYFMGRVSGISSMEKKLLKAEAKQWEAENALQKQLSKTAHEADHVVNNGDVVGELHKHGEIRPNE